MSQMKEYLAGKTVVIVGPASTLQDKKMGSMIDAYDIVVRINHAWPLPGHLHEDIGSRTDILYHNLNPKKQSFSQTDLYKMREDGMKWIVSTHPASRARYHLRQRRIRKMSKGLVNFRVIPLSVKKHLRPHVGSVNGGLMAIVDLLRYPIELLYVTGFSFYTTGYLSYPNYRSEFIESALNHHNQKKHKAYLARLVTGDKRLVVDSVVARLLHKHM